MSDSYGPGGATAGDVVERAVNAYRDLVDLAESVEDEWQYVTDLAQAYLPSIRALAAPDPGKLLGPELVVAVDEAIAEIGLITDPHKAIDWLSTFPHVVGLALGGDVDRPDGDGGHGSANGGTGGGGPTEPDEDSPFRMLSRRDR